MVAVVPFGLLFLARLRIGDPDEAILYMLVVPILLLAFEFGGGSGRRTRDAVARSGPTDLSTVDP